MQPGQVTGPPFGEANLNNCEREQIHLAGSIQPHGALLIIRELDGTIVQASANARSFLRLEKDPLGLHLRALGGSLWEHVRPYLSKQIQKAPVAIRCDIGARRIAHNVLLHHPKGGGLAIEVEYADAVTSHAIDIERALRSFLEANSLISLCNEVANLFKELTGYDRVMVYRFDEEGHGEVLSETRKPELEAFLGNRYPASDIPQIARRLYELNRVRLLVDVEYEPVHLIPQRSPLTGADLDMSLCFLRSVSPIHIQYLKNMGVRATLVVSIMVSGKLWGLIACHHYAPRSLHFEMRTVCELLAESIGTRITALESFAEGQGQIAARRIEQRMAGSIARTGHWRTALFDSARSLLLPLNATGAALIYDGEVHTTGIVPGTEQILDLSKWLATRTGTVYATANLRAEAPAFSHLTDVSAGLVAVPISGEPHEMLIWFRQERIRTVTWGGNPNEKITLGDDPRELSPRRSFAQWHQVVEGTSDPWTQADLRAAESIGASITDVILQFRAVQVLIMQDQLELVLQQVRTSQQQVVIAAADGRIIKANAAFNEMIGARTPITTLDDLPHIFSNPGALAGAIRQMKVSHKSWRGELELFDLRGAKIPVLLRADPVLAGPGRLLGFVLLFTDLTTQKSAEIARRQFQDGILRMEHTLSEPLSSRSDLVRQSIVSAVIENAHLAALEITDSSTTANMPDMLDSIRASVARAIEAIEQLGFRDPTEPESDL